MHSGASARFRTRPAALSCLRMFNAASASRMAEKVAFRLAASVSVISICCSLRSNAVSLTCAPSVSKKVPLHRASCAPVFHLLFCTLHHIPGFSDDRCRPCRYLPEDSDLNGSLCDNMFNRKFKRREAGSSTAYCPPGIFPDIALSGRGPQPVRRACCMTGSVISAGSLAYPLICIRITLCLSLKPRARRVIQNLFTGSPVKMAGFFMFMARLRDVRVQHAPVPLCASRQAKKREDMPVRPGPSDINRRFSARVPAAGVKAGWCRAERYPCSRGVTPVSLSRAS